MYNYESFRWRMNSFVCVLHCLSWSPLVGRSQDVKLKGKFYKSREGNYYQQGVSHMKYWKTIMQSRMAALTGINSEL